MSQKVYLSGFGLTKHNRYCTYKMYKIKIYKLQKGAQQKSLQWNLSNIKPHSIHTIVRDILLRKQCQTTGHVLPKFWLDSASRTANDPCFVQNELMSLSTAQFLDTDTGLLYCTKSKLCTGEKPTQTELPQVVPKGCVSQKWKPVQTKYASTAKHSFNSTRPWQAPMFCWEYFK